MYFLYQKQILTKWNFNPMLKFGPDIWILTIQLFGPNYSNSCIVFGQKYESFGGGDVSHLEVVI